MTITHVQKWGNSYAVRIPKTLIKSLAINSTTTLEIREEEGKLILTPVARRQYSLSEMVLKITPDNIHGEIDFWNDIGNEVW